jgi:hypothetical protein
MAGETGRSGNHRNLTLVEADILSERACQRRSALRQLGAVLLAATAVASGAQSVRAADPKPEPGPCSDRRAGGITFDTSDRRCGSDNDR